MAILFVNPGSPRGRLRLSLSNLDGLSQDAHDVKWTVLRPDGMVVSGRKISATKINTGVYEASWVCSNVGGCYLIKWEYQIESGQPKECVINDFYVVSPSYYQNFLKQQQSGLALSDTCKAFGCGQPLGPTDLCLFLKDENGIPGDAYAVYWSIINDKGCPITERFTALSGMTVGSYYAPWFVNVGGGNYKIKWEYLETADDPLESVCMNFSVICYDLFNVNDACTITSDSYCVSSDSLNSQCCIIKKIFIPSSSPCTFTGPVITVAGTTKSECCPFEIPRVIHLLEQNLPPGGAWTNQVVWTIPTRIRKITFYITYTRGTNGGFANYRLLWGNGVEETQSTLIDCNFTGVNPAESMQDMYLNDLRGPEPQDGNPVRFTIEATIPGGATTVRLLAAEAGQQGAPGVSGITLTAASV